MFSNFYSEADLEVRKTLGDIKVPDTKSVEQLLEKSLSHELSLEDIASLLEIGKGEQTEEQLKLVRSHFYREFRKERNSLKHIAPVYLSSHCVDRCGYCNFAAQRKGVQRTRLSLSDLEKELETVIFEGNNVIEFTLATDPEFGEKELTSYIEKANELLAGERGSGILLCSDYFSKESYESLRGAGLWGMVQWDETLDHRAYQKWHRAGPRKSLFENRIDNHDRAIQAGLQVANGCLFGLSDYRYDVLMQVAKARYLHKEYGVRPFVFGTPRIKPVAGKSLQVKNVVSDEQYELALMVYKIAEPQIERWLQTRETPELNLRNIANGDVYTYQCGEVKPGGYSVNVERINSARGGQFNVNEMTKGRLEEALTWLNFRADYAWIK